MSFIFYTFRCGSVLKGWGFHGSGGASASGRLVGSQDLVDPSTELGDTGVDGRGGGGATAASPGHDANQGPGVVLLTDQGTTRVALKHKQTNSGE